MYIIKLFKLLKGFGWFFLLVALLTVFHQFSYSYVPLFTQYLFKVLEHREIIVTDVGLPQFILSIIQSAPTIINTVLRIALILVFYQSTRFLMRFFELNLKGHIQEGVTNNLKIKTYDHIQNMGYAFHQKYESGDLIQRVTSDIELTTRFLANDLMEIIALISTIVFGAYQIMQINQTIVWVTLGFIPIVGVLSTIYFLKMEKVFFNIEKTESSMMTVIQENLSSSKVVRAFANEAFEIRKLEDKNFKYKKAYQNANKIIAVYWGFMDFMSIMQYLLVILLGLVAYKNNSMDAADMIAILALIGMLVFPIRGLGRIINNFSQAIVAANRIHEILDQSSEFSEDGTLEPTIKGKIEFRNVRFKYDEHWVLDGVSFVAEPGETVAIIGRTGSGKSTILNLLLRIYEPNEGEILIDDIPLKRIKKQYIRKQIATVLQEPFLYARTVLENIKIAAPQASNESALEAAEIASIHQDIKTFKQGYDTLVGEKGTTLSGGQKQRVAIARVLVQMRPILFFDDALSAVDTKTDMNIRKKLNETTQAKTTFIVTHRITTAKSADKILVLQNGIIADCGNHQSLIEKEGLYQKLWEIQGKIELSFFESLEDESV